MRLPSVVSSLPVYVECKSSAFVCQAGSPVSPFSGAEVKRNSFEAIRPIAGRCGAAVCGISRGSLAHRRVFPVHITTCFLYTSQRVSCTCHYVFPVHETTCFPYMKQCVSCTCHYVFHLHETLSFYTDLL